MHEVAPPHAVKLSAPMLSGKPGSLPELPAGSSLGSLENLETPPPGAVAFSTWALLFDMNGN